MSNTLRPPTKLTVVEEGTQFKGTLTSSCPIDVRGRVEGELHTPALTIGASGAVHGRVKVGEVHSQGEISGEFEADKIQLSGTVKDNTVIRARSLDVKLCAERGKLEIVFGACELSVGEEPTETDHLAKPEAAPLTVVAPVAAPLMPEPLPAPMPEAVVAEAAPAPEAAAAPAAEDDETEEDGAEAAEGESGGKRKRKRKNGQDETATGWSQRPSQPPPA
jgi:cytoskeletal protein CcmA (bactofilin family)